MKPVDIAGQRFGKLKAVKVVGTGKKRLWLCDCECGKQATVPTHQLRGGNNTSCGCSQYDRPKKPKRRRVRLSKSPLELRVAETWAACRANAKRKGRVCTIGKLDVLNVLTQECHYCGDDAQGLDRKDNNVGYTPENSLPCCTVCNYMKRDMPYDEFIGRVERIAKVFHSETQKTS